MAPPRRDECEFTGTPRQSGCKVRIAQAAAAQFGRLRWDQLVTIGVSERTICRWVSDGYLHPELPRVYAVGHRADSVEGRLAAALLYAGPGAALSHGTAVWWWGLLRYPPPEIHISTPRNVRNRDSIVVHGRRSIERLEHKGLPVASASQALLDFAAKGERRLLRLALATADYEGVLDVQELARLTGRGIPGSAALGAALKVHLPALASTRSELEVLLLELCERQGLPIPRVNVYVHGWLVDAFWADAKLVVEVDGWRGHRSAAQLRRDHERDLELRLAGFIVVRYAWHQLTDTPAAVAADLRRYLT